MICITAYSSTYMKMTSEETSAENSELVIKSLGGQVICLRLLMRLGALHHARFLGSCLYIMKLVMLLFNVKPPGLLTSNMLAKIYDHEYRTRVPSTQSWLLRHHDWTSSNIVWEQMCTYQDIDATILRVVKQSLLQHLWYLTEKLLIPAYFMSLRFLF